MKRVKLTILCLLCGALGYVVAAWQRSAEAKPTAPAFMVGVNGVDVHRFADVYEGGVIHCYVAKGNWNGHMSPAIACVKR